MSYSSKDKKIIWHPFTPQAGERNNIVITRGNGALLFDENGNEYVDAIASWWVNLHGHSHPYIAGRISEQLPLLEHSIFSGFTHKPGVELAERLLALMPGMTKVFYSDDGSTAVEVSIKMALQYWYNIGKKRTKIIAFENAYHGDTFGGMSVGARNAFNNAFESLLFEVVHIPVPVKGQEARAVAALEDAVDENTCAFIFEPLVLGAAGMIMYEAEILDKLISICHEKNVICIADEVMTGFGRTGKMFASDYLANKPDIVCLSKGLTGGFFPLGATLCTEKIHSAYLTSDKTKTFFHGHSYTGNIPACTAALASLDLFQNENTFARIRELADRFNSLQKEFALHPKVKNARSTGSILALELHSTEQTGYLNSLADRALDYFPQYGVILRPLGNVLYIIPPYCITKEQMDKVVNSIHAFLQTI